MAEPSFLRRLILCPMGLCQTFRTAFDDTACWGECTICGRRSGEVSREALRRCAEAEERDRRLQNGGSIFPRFEVNAPMPKPPRGGPIETPAPPLALTIAPSLDSLHPAFEEPLIGYISKTGYRLFREEPDWHTALYRDQGELNAKGGVVEAEIRVRRVIDR